MSKNDSMLVDPDPTYTVAQLDLMILSALRLGFHDDVRHWRAIRQAKVAYEREAGLR